MFIYHKGNKVITECINNDAIKSVRKDFNTFLLAEPYIIYLKIQVLQKHFILI